MNVPDGLHYTKEHEWVLFDEAKKIATIGITDFAQESLGDITFLELPQEGEEVKQNDTFGVVESVKAVSDLYAPVTGKVVEINSPLLEAPEQVNEEPYTTGWLIRVEAESPNLGELLSAEAYRKFIEEEQ